MKLPFSWLREWVEVDASPEQIAEALTTRGFYVEAVEPHGRRYPGIVLARVLEAKKHPNADKLKLCRVDDGRGELRSEEHTSELQSLTNLVCRLLLEKKKSI